MAIPAVNAFSQQPGGGINTAMRGINAVAKENLENAYYGPTQQANIAAKNTYAQYLPAQTLATIISQPQFWSQPKNVVDSILERYRNAISNPPSVESLSGGNPMGGGLLSMLFDKLGMSSNPFSSGQGSSGNRGSNPLASGGNGYVPGDGPSQDLAKGPVPAGQPDLRKALWEDDHPVGTPIPDSFRPDLKGPSSGEPEAPAAAAGPASPTSVGVTPPNIPPANGSSASGMPTSRTERIAVNQGAGGNMYGGINPNSIVSAQAAGLNAYAAGEAGAQTEQQKILENNDAKAAQAAVETNQLLTKAKNLHAQIPQWQRGKIGGYTPAVTAAADELDTTVESIVANMANQQTNGNVTDAGRELARKSKQSRSMTDEAFNHLIEYNSGMNDRAVEKPAFNQAFFEKGYTPAQVNALWLYYQTKKPFYDNKMHTKDSSNLGSWDRFYDSADKIKAAFSPSAAKAVEKTMGSQANTNVLPGHMALPGGLIVPKTFDSQADFHEWYNAQPESTQKAYSEFLEQEHKRKKGKK